MGTKKKADYMVDNGTDWDQMLFSTTAEQVGFTKSDGSETNLQDEVTALNSHLEKLRHASTSITDCNNLDYFLASFANFEGTGNAPGNEVRGIVMVIVDGIYPTEGGQITQLFFSYFNGLYMRTVIEGQSWGSWVALT